jgi:hypothetical protein
MATLQTVIDEARVILQDAAKVRYTDAQLTVICNYAIASALRIRPDLDFANVGNAPATLLIGDPFPFPPQFEPVVSNYIASRAELRDDEYSVDGRVAVLNNEFKSALVGVA